MYVDEPMEEGSLWKGERRLEQDRWEEETWLWFQAAFKVSM